MVLQIEQWWPRLCNPIGRHSFSDWLHNQGKVGICNISNFRIKSQIDFNVILANMCLVIREVGHGRRVEVLSDEVWNLLFLAAVNQEGREVGRIRARKLIEVVYQRGLVVANDVQLVFNWANTESIRLALSVRDLERKVVGCRRWVLPQ